MSRLSSQLPPSTLDRARLGALTFAVFNAIMIVPQQQPDLTLLNRIIGVGSVAVLVADFVLTYARRKAFWWEPLLVGPLIIGYGLHVTAISILLGMTIGVTVTQSLYGSGRSVALRTIALVASTGFVLVLPSDPDGRAANVPTMIVLIVPILFTGVMRLVGVSLIRLEQAGGRQELLAETGLRLAGLTDTSAVYAVMSWAGEKLTTITPGLALIAARLEPGEAVILDAHGVAEGMIGRTVALGRLEDSTDDKVGVLHRLPEPAALDLLVGRRRSGWSVLDLGAPDATLLLLIGSTARSVSDEILDTMRTLVSQQTLAEANCQAHAELTRLAHHDQLTTTPNRRAFFARLTTAIATAGSAAAGELALLIIDLDDFKQVNDTWGHQAGDEVLIEIAERLSAVAGRTGVASRFGGDEFAILLTQLPSQDEADRIAELVCTRLQEPIALSNGITAIVGGSVGIVGGSPTAAAEDLMRCADIAMYSAKARGKNRVERYTEERHGQVAHVRQLEDHLAHIVERDEIVLHYQPLIDLKTGHCTAMEALIRWQHPGLGLLLPGDFMALAERHGHMGPITRHVLRAACHQLRAWNTAEPPQDLRICVNATARLLLTPEFGQNLQAVLAETGVPADHLSLEFSDSDVLDQETARDQLAVIAGTGVRIALDNFGLGKISLANLQALQLSQLKIDCRTFGEVDASTATDMIHFVMSVSRFLRLESVAKMIETSAHLEWARQAGLTLGQGHYLRTPMTADEATAWLLTTTSPTRP
jgi:diguanylate cyclase (GGDEF)-like protein